MDPGRIARSPSDPSRDIGLLDSCNGILSLRSISFRLGCNSIGIERIIGIGQSLGQGIGIGRIVVLKHHELNGPKVEQMAF